MNNSDVFMKFPVCKGLKLKIAHMNHFIAILKCISHNCFLKLSSIFFKVDNQLHDGYFTTVLAPTPLPAYLAKKSDPKPFIELSILRRQSVDEKPATIK